MQQRGMAMIMNATLTLYFGPHHVSASVQSGPAWVSACAPRAPAEAVEDRALEIRRARVVFYLYNLSVLCMHACTGIWEASNKSLNKRSGHGRYSYVQYYFFYIQALSHTALCVRLSNSGGRVLFCFVCLCAPRVFCVLVSARPTFACCFFY